MNILITGASRGIGKEIALNFAKSGKCHTLFLLSRNKIKLEAIADEIKTISSGIKINLVSADFNSDNLSETIAQISCNRIDVVVNNAGYLVNKPFTELSPDDINEMLQVNFTGVVRLIQLLTPKLGGEKNSHVVNIGSMGGFQGSSKFPGLSIYSASKAALASLSECLAVEYADKNVSFNCLALGAVQTEMLSEAFPGFKAPVSPNSIAKYIVDFSFEGHRFFNGKILPVALTDPK